MYENSCIFDFCDYNYIYFHFLKGFYMINTKIAIFENNADFLNQLTSCIAAESGYEVVASSADGREAVELISKTKPDIAIVDLVLSGLDGFGVLDYIRSECRSCKTIAVSGMGDEEIINSAIDHGAMYYLLKPVDCTSVMSRIKDISGRRDNFYRAASEIRERRKGITLDEKISGIFMTIGIPPHIKGFAFLRDGIKMTVDEPSIINRVTKELYPRIAEKYNTTASKVERAIRHAIEVAWNRGRADAISSVFGARVYIGSERPTNSEFIALVADKLILESLE